MPPEEAVQVTVPSSCGVSFLDHSQESEQIRSVAGASQFFS